MATDEPGFSPTDRLWEAFVTELSRGLRTGVSRSHGALRDRNRTVPKEEEGESESDPRGDGGEANTSKTSKSSKKTKKT